MSQTDDPAFERLQRFLVSDPDNLELLAAAADAAIREGVSDKALPHIEHALKLQPLHPQFRYRRAVALRRASRLAEAQQTLADLAEQGERHPVPLYELADLHYQQRAFDSCIATLEMVLLTPDYRIQVPKTDLLYVRALHHLGRLEEAIAHAETALAAQPKDVEIAGALATLLLDADRTDEAAQIYERATRAGVVTAELKSAGGFLALQAEDAATARQLFGEALATQPSDGRARLGAGLAAATMQELDAAIEQLQAATKLMPTHLGSWNALAWMQLMSGQLDAAEQTFVSANEIDHSFAENHGGLAVVAAMRGNTASAREAIRTAIKLDKNCFSAAYASLLLQHGPKASGAVLEPMMHFLSKQLMPNGKSVSHAVATMAARRHRH